MIFIQIASYRDSQLLPTITDALKKAKHPLNLVFGVVDQSTVQTSSLASSSIIRYIHVAPMLSEGACWARAKANTLYNGEEFFMQIDSHTRFAEHWDEILLKQLEHTCCPNPVLSCYPNKYWLEDGKDVYGPEGCYVAVVSGWTGTSVTLAPGNSVSVMRNGLSLAGGFIFGIGSFASVPYDPNIYFLGEEIILSVQAFTRGFDILHPSSCPIFHYYIRNEEVKHWTDHPTWYIKNEASTKRVHDALTGMIPNYFGTSRSLQMYEQYSGISFATQTHNDRAKNGF